MKRITYISLFCTLFFLTSYAQVGIGTENPDDSSLLELKSDSQGMLTPRMTSTQRTAIASPAEGLLVYDTDETAFYFYTSGTWKPIGSAEKRNNYVLVKSEADFPAPSSGVITLEENTLYEINGTISLSAPIDLNGAYVIGLDTNEDVLLKSGGTMFTGNKGGSLRNITLTAPGGSVFGLNDTVGDQTFIMQSCVVANSGSVGTVKGFNLVFFNIVQYAGNTTGVTYENIEELLLNNQGWSESNSGTYERFVGNFKLIEKASGFSIVNGSNVGVDVSSNPSVVSGIILGTAFTGTATTFVNRYTTGSYTGFSFNKNWFVNCPGIPFEADLTASGNFYFNGALTTGFSQNISNGTAVEIQGTGTFAPNNLLRFAASGGSNRLTYEGSKRREFNVSASLSVRVTGATGNFYAIMIAKNGTILTESNAVVYIESDAQIQNISLNTNVNLSNGDYIEVFTQRLTGTGTDTLVVFSENLSIN